MVLRAAVRVSLPSREGGAPRLPQARAACLLPPQPVAFIYEALRDIAA